MIPTTPAYKLAGKRVSDVQDQHPFPGDSDITIALLHPTDGKFPGCHWYDDEADEVCEERAGFWVGTEDSLGWKAFPCCRTHVANALWGLSFVRDAEGAEAWHQAYYGRSGHGPR